MSRNRIYGRAYKISEAEAKAYERTSRPRKYRPNPLGVTAMASVNGRGSYRSARAVAQGKSRDERLERARRVIRNGNGESNMARRAGFLKNLKKNPGLSRAKRKTPEEYARIRAAAEERVAAMPTKKKSRKVAKKTATKKAPKLSAAAKAAKAKRGGKRLAAYMAAKRAGKSAEAAKRSALRKVPLKVGESFKGTAKKTATRRKAKKVNRIVGAAKPVRKPKKTRTYERLYMIDPKTGKRRLSFMAKGKKGKRIKIPAKVLVSSGYMKEEAIRKARQKAADRILKSGDAFVPNKRSTKKMKTKSAKQKRAGRRLAAYRKALASGSGKKAAAVAAIRSVPLKEGDTFLGLGKGSVAKKPAKRRRKKSAKKVVRKSKARKTTRKKAKKAVRKTSKRRKSVARKTTTRRRKKTAKKAVSKRSRKVSRKRKSAGKRKVTRKSKASTKRKSSKRKYRRNGTAGAPTRKYGSRVRRRKSYRRNSFLAQLKSLAVTGLFVAGGFLSHKILTNVVVSKVFDKFAASLPAPVQTWKRPIVGLAVLAVGVPLSKALFKKNSTEIAAGMVASWLQTTIVTALTGAGKPDYAGYLSGYSNSRAYQLRGHETSIMPRYVPLGAYQQAAAGYQQAAAGYQQAAAGTGEYFTAANGVGEYFAANGVGEYFAANGLQGVGSYEGAGTLALQAAAGADDIDDGIRPDSDLDGILDLAEAAAGLRGVGEAAAVRAGGGRVVERRVGTQSQWIPTGPLWAGETAVDATLNTSAVSAGILQRPGGNGILSAG